MAAGSEPASAGNVKAFYEALKNGGVSEGFIKDLKALRKAMGLGDTLGKVPMDCLDVALTDSVDDSTIGQNMAVTPKGVYEYMMHKEGGYANVAFTNNTSDKTVTAAPVFSNAICDGESVSIKSNKIDVASCGFYEITVSGIAVSTTNCKTISVLLVVNGQTITTNKWSYDSFQSNVATSEFTREIYIPSGAFVEIKLVSSSNTSSNYTWIKNATGSFTIKRI